MARFLPARIEGKYARGAGWGDFQKSGVMAMRLADCRKAFTNRCPHHREMMALKFRSGRGTQGGLTYYDPRHWREAQRFCQGCVDFQPIRGQGEERGEPKVSNSEVSLTSNPS